MKEYKDCDVRRFLDSVTYSKTPKNVFEEFVAQIKEAKRKLIMASTREEFEAWVIEWKEDLIWVIVINDEEVLLRATELGVSILENMRIARELE